MTSAQVAPWPARTDTVPLDDAASAPRLPPELWWRIVDLLLSTDGYIKDAVRLGLTCRTLASTILDDEHAWRQRCRRDFGAERVALHVERKHFGVRWLCLYASMATRIETGTVAKPRADRPGYGWLQFREYRCGSFVGVRSYGYTFTAARPCAAGYRDRTVIMEYKCDADERPDGWMSMRRLTGALPLDLGDEFVSGDLFCPCVLCRGTAPKNCDVVRAHLTTYRGGWRDRYPHGTGRATFAGGALVYEGEWEDGLPHGCGSLNGGALREWFRGTCVVRARVCGCRVDGTYGCCTGGSDTGSVAAKWHYDGQLVVRPGQDDSDASNTRDDDSDLERWYEMADEGKDTLWRAMRPVTPHGFGEATYVDGTTFTGLWCRANRESGTCTTGDGTTFVGRWPCHSVGFGEVRWPSGTSTRCMVWHWWNQPRVYEYSTYPDAHNHAVCRCPPTDTTVLGTRRRPWPSRHATVLLHNGDVVVMRWAKGDADTMGGIHSFVFSPDCADASLAGTTIDNCEWTCQRVPRRLPPRPRCPDDYIYWPSNLCGQAWAKFALYVRKGLIGWDKEAIAFWHSLHGPPIDPMPP